MSEQIVEETQELCTLCGGRGQEQIYGVATRFTTCRQCNGSRYIVTKRTIRRIVPDPAADAEKGT